MVLSQDLVNILEKPPKLMYRPPGRDEYINITEAFDELYNKLECIEAKLNNMENKPCQDKCQ